MSQSTKQSAQNEKHYNVNLTVNQSILFQAINDMIEQAVGKDVGNAHQVLSFALRHIGFESRLGESSNGVRGLIVFEPEDKEISEQNDTITHSLIMACCAGSLSTLKLAEFKIKTDEAELARAAQAEAQAEVDSGVVKH